MGLGGCLIPPAAPVGELGEVAAVEEAQMTPYEHAIQQLLDVAKLLLTYPQEQAGLQRRLAEAVALVEKRRGN